MRDEVRHTLYAPLIAECGAARMRAEYLWYVSPEISAQVFADLTPAAVSACGWPCWKLTLVSWDGLKPQQLTRARVAELRRVRDEVMQGAGVGPWEEDRQSHHVTWRRWLSLTDLNEVSALVVDSIIGRLQTARRVMTVEQERALTTPGLPLGCQVHLTSLLSRGPPL